MKPYLANRVRWRFHDESVRAFFRAYYECHLESRYG